MQIILARLLLRLLALLPLRLLHAVAVPIGWLVWKMPGASTT
jgi:hypothetical protein